MSFTSSDLEAKGFQKSSDGSWRKDVLPGKEAVAHISSQKHNEGIVTGYTYQFKQAIIAIDPGASGGVAIRGLDGTVEAFSLKVEGILVELIQKRSYGPLNAKCYIEMITGYNAPKKNKFPSMGEDEDEFDLEKSGYRMFNYGQGYGELIGAVKMAGIPLEFVLPREWQKPLYLKRGGASRQIWKNMLKAKAQQLFPFHKVTLGKSDALLILNYALLKQQ